MIVAIIALFIGLLIAFAAIILLYMKVAQLKGLERKQQIMMREMDQLVSAYLVDMKEENDRFIAEVQKQPKVKKSLFNEPIEKPKPKPTAPYVPPMPEEELTYELPTTFKGKATAAYASQPPTKKEPKPTFEEALKQATLDEQRVEEPPTLQQQVQQLHSEGRSIEEIAKQLSKGKTEVELLLKFNAQK